MIFPKIRIPNPEDISLLRAAHAMWRFRKINCAIVLGAVFVGICYALLATPYYRAATKIMPPKQQANASSMLALLGGGDGMSMGGGGIGAALGLKNPNDIYVALLKSNKVGLAIAEKYNLQKYYRQKYEATTLRVLGKRTQVLAGKDGLISVEFEDKDPLIAAAIANEYIVELRCLTKEFSLSEASQRKKHYESQLLVVKDSLAYAEGLLRTFQEKTGLIDVAMQSSTSIEAMARIRGEIASKEIEIQMMSQYAGSNNQGILQAKTALNELRKQLRSLTRGKGDEVLIGREKTPELGMEYIRRARNVKYFETLFEIIAKQYEMARMDEAQDGMVIQVVDSARAPEFPVRPRKKTIVILFMLVGVLGTGIVTVLIDLFKMPLSDASGERVDQKTSIL